MIDRRQRGLKIKNTAKHAGLPNNTLHFPYMQITSRVPEKASERKQQKKK